MVDSTHPWGVLVNDIAICAEVTPVTAELYLKKRGYTAGDPRLLDEALRNDLLCASFDLTCSPFPQAQPAHGEPPRYVHGQLAPDWEEVLNARVSAAFDPPASWSGYWKALQMVSVLLAVTEDAASKALSHFLGSEDPRMNHDDTYRDSVIQSALLFIHSSSTTH